jgi:hypothetical protein
MSNRSIGFVLLCLLTASPLFARTDPANWCGTRGVELTKYFLKVNEKHQRERERNIQAAETNKLRTDIGEVAVIHSSASTLIQRNLFDLTNKKIIFTRNSPADFNIRITGGAVAATQGNIITLGDDNSRRIGFTSGFSFPFYGSHYTAVFVNSDGNLTFRTGDRASTARDVLRVVTGPPRIAPFFHDMNSSARGTIRVLQTATKFAVTWNDVTEFRDFGTNSNTFQINLFKNGNIEFIYGSKVDTKDPVVGISPGNSTVANLRLVNYSSVNLTAIRGAVIERFATSQDVDYTAVVNEFHATHPKIFDFVVIFTDFPVNLEGGDAFAFFSPIQNQIRGIGSSNFNYTKPFGSRKIQGFLVMGFIGKYPTDINREFFREYSAVEIMAHEGAHRWLFYPHAIINGVPSEDLLGLQNAHYSFYVDADASFMEGNNIVDNGNGSFTTTAVSETYNKLDLYLMGFLPAAQVPPFFLVAGNSDKTRFPESGATVLGTRVDVNIAQIIQAEGSRVPTAASSQKRFRSAFILFTKQQNPSPDFLQRVDRLRTAWQALFHSKTSNKGVMDTTLP